MASQRDLLLHPIRMRIVQLLARQPLTIQAMGRLIPDVPQATLYRHVNTLVKTDFVTVLEEHQKRGTVERVYGLQEKTWTLLPSELAQVSKEDSRRFFAAMIAAPQRAARRDKKSA